MPFLIRKQGEQLSAQVDEGSVQFESNEGDLSVLQQQLGYTFVSSELLLLGLTHRSAQLKGKRSDYERLEFLGDAVLDLAVAHLLLDHYPEAQEGELSKMRAALVNTSSLADIAKELDLGKYIRLSKSEMASGGAHRTSILADVLEALFGAIYKDGGFNAAFEAVKVLFKERLLNVIPRDPKTELQEALHAAGRDAPKYLLECVEGPEHAPTFVSIVLVGELMLGRGRGATKKASQQAAASEALQQISQTTDQEESLVLNPQKE